MARKMRPGALCDANAVEPFRLDWRLFVNLAGRSQSAFVEERVGNGYASGEMLIDDGVDRGKIRLACDMMGLDAVYPRIERREVIARVDEGFIFEDLSSIAEADDPDLTDAADPRARGFHVDHHEIGAAST